MGLCLHLHPSPDEGSMVICKIFISMVVGEGRFRYPLLCPENNLGSLLGPGFPFIIKSLVNPKMTTLVQVYTSLIPYPSFLPPPSQSHEFSQFLPYSLLSNPLPFQQPPHPPPCARGYLALLSISNLQADNYMIFNRFTFLLSFSRITNNWLKDL